MDKHADFDWDSIDGIESRLKKGFMMKAAGKFKTYKQEKADQFSGAVKKSKQGEDRLLDDKKFLLKLSKVQTILPSKK